MAVMISVADFRAEARAWLAEQLPPKERGKLVWGEGSDEVAFIRNYPPEAEREAVRRCRDWIRAKAEAGYSAIHWEQEHGGAGLTVEHTLAFADEEARFEIPPPHESLAVTFNLVGNTIRACGTPEQKERYLPSIVRGEDLWCQLFSEPGAGSDIASLQTRAVRSGDTWTVDGQKVWTSGAQVADWGYLLARTDFESPKHRGITAFLVDMAASGVTVRPLRVMTGGSPFNEVFLDGVEIPEERRLGELGQGWKVALTTLAHERSGAGAAMGTDTDYAGRLALLAQHLGLARDPLVRQRIARVFASQWTTGLINRRAADAARAGRAPGAEGSMGKLVSTEFLRLVGDTAADLLGMRGTADTGEWGTFAWSALTLDVCGGRIAGGTDEVQRNIIAERVLGLPAEPRPA